MVKVGNSHEKCCQKKSTYNGVDSSHYLNYIVVTIFKKYMMDHMKAEVNNLE